MTSSTRAYEPFIQKLAVAAKQVRPTDRAELATVVVLLFTSIRTCHAAYRRFRDDQGETTYDEWAESINGLQSVINQLDATLHIFAPDVFAGVRGYLALEAIGSHRYRKTDESVRMLEDSLRLGSPEPPDVGYQDVIDGLGAFIRNTFTMDEIFQASAGRDGH